MRWYEWTSLVVVTLFSVLVVVILFGGVIPCNHRCYWCRKPLCEADQPKRLAGYVWSLSGKPCIFASMKHSDEWRAVYFEEVTP